MANQWFRMYHEFATDPVIQSLAFEDQRHYVVLLCLKCQGVLDRDIAPQHRERIILRGLGLDPVAGNEAKRRLMEVGLIEKNWQIPGWDKRQFVSDNSTERVRNYRKNKTQGNVSETFSKRSGNAPETETETDTEKEITPPTPPPKPKPPKKPPTDERAFAAFWCEYPKKVGKQDAKKAWDKLSPSPELAREIISHVQTRRQSDEQWNRDNGRAIPHPATFINGKRWEDVYLVREQSFAERLAASRSSSRRSDFGEDGADIREAMDFGF